MPYFQIPNSNLFPGGTRLYLSGNGGTERLVLEPGVKVTLELAGLPANAKPAVRQLSPVTAMDLMALVLAGKSSGPDILDISPLTGSGAKRSFTITGKATGSAALIGDGLATLLVVVGHFNYHTDMEFDLIAETFRKSNPAKTHVLARTLFSNWDNLFNEDSEANQRHWCPDYPKRGCLPCGTVSKVGASLIFHSVDYSYFGYYKPLPGMGNASARAALSRADIKYDAATLDKAIAAIRGRLSKGIPSIVGLSYIPSSAIRPNGTFAETGEGGHTVPIVGCSFDSKKFLYIDVYPKGSKLKYSGGHAGVDLFPNACHYLGIFERVSDDAGRGTDVLRTPDILAGDSGIFTNPQYLEVVSGPLS